MGHLGRKAPQRRAARVAKAVARCRDQFADGTHDETCGAVETLGKIAGVAAQRPEEQSATDAVWAWAGRRRADRRSWKIEDGAPDAVPRDWINQAVGQLAAETPSDDVRLTAVVVDLNTVEADAARNTIAIVHRDALADVADTNGGHLLRYAAARTASCSFLGRSSRLQRDRAAVDLALGGGVLGDLGDPRSVRRRCGEVPLHVLVVHRRTGCLAAAAPALADRH